MSADVSTSSCKLQTNDTFDQRKMIRKAERMERRKMRRCGAAREDAKDLDHDSCANDETKIKSNDERIGPTTHVPTTGEEGLSKVATKSESYNQEAALLQQLRHNVSRKGRYQVLIDLDFESLMNPRECRSTVAQCVYAYSVCKSVALDVFPRFVGAKIDGEVYRKLTTFPGYPNWWTKCETETLQDLFPCSADRTHLVYLTGDSPNRLDVGKDDQRTLDDVYIIGGFVDRNRHKGTTLKKAQELGIRTARLPLTEEFAGFQKSNMCKTLTINHVISLLVRVLVARDSWSAAIDRVLPHRHRSHSKDDGIEAKDSVVME